jgi:Flp pilus assembly protein TadG
MRFLRGFRDDENGGLAILFAFLMFSVTVLAGIGVDYGRALSARYDMQQALDAAVLAGVKYEVASRDTSAREYFNVSMTNPDADDVKVTFESPKQDTLTGRATAEVRTTLTGLLGVQSISIQTTAAAAASGGSPVCVLALSKTASQQLLVNSGADVVAPDCEVHAKSTASPVAIFNSGTKLDTKRICLAGSTIIDNGGTHPNVYKSCSTAEDPTRASCRCQARRRAPRATATTTAGLFS